MTKVDSNIYLNPIQVGLFENLEGPGGAEELPVIIWFTTLVVLKCCMGIRNYGIYLFCQSDD